MEIPSCGHFDIDMQEALSTKHLPTKSSPGTWKAVYPRCSEHLTSPGVSILYFLLVFRVIQILFGTLEAAISSCALEPELAKEARQDRSPGGLGLFLDNEAI